MCVFITIVAPEFDNHTTSFRLEAAMECTLGYLPFCHKLFGFHYLKDKAIFFILKQSDDKKMLNYTVIGCLQKYYLAFNSDIPPFWEILCL